ncbi:MAG: Rab family GTPase [Candidatus Odinarchaeota archaeon]
MSSGKTTYLMKIILAGDGAVGKTSLRERYLGRGFTGQYLETVGADFALKIDNIGGENIKFQIWDLAGQPRFQTVRSVYYSGAKGALLLFDITRRSSFENLNSWVDEIWKHNGSGVIPIVVLGNKYDLRDDFAKCIEESEAREFCSELSEQTKEKGFEIKFLNTSAKTGLNVEESFQTLGKVFFDFLKEYLAKKS